jgi:heterodisulfide reductase subunit C
VIFSLESPLNACFTCGTCSGGCPLTGMESTKDEGLDCRKVIRMAAFGMDQEVIDSRFVWICTGCQRCEIGCPMGVKLVKVWMAAKAAGPRDKVPGVLHKGVDMVLKTGNNMGIPEDDYVTLLEELGEELAEECCPGFVTPVEKVGADYLHFQNSKEAYAEPDDMKWWWKIFYAAKADWTTSSKNWESVDWGIFTANMEASKEIARRKVENMKRLQAKTFILPDCCGAGSGNWPGPFEKEKTEHGGFKARDIQATGADLVISGCSNCRDQIMKNLKPKFKLDIEGKYIWEMVADALILEE